MFIQLAGLCLAVLTGAVYCQNSTSLYNSQYYCERINNVDCSHFNTTIMCATNKVTYKNRCELGKAYCVDHRVDYWHIGPCDGNTEATRSPAEVQRVSEVVLQFECTYLGHIPCQPAMNEKVCGTDGKTYPTFCEYEKARCMHKYLHVANIGDCVN